ncbi:hypothetical protein GCM10017673_38540 [Streptosporangium violaceochromogenes]|nr:hypothetical protein GCM10017673_38540 [Streptosporangium violaceochromogenes]
MPRTPAATRHRAPISRRHADDTPCTHRKGQDCPGVTSYTATCTCGHWEQRSGIRAAVEEQRAHHLHNR